MQSSSPRVQHYVIIPVDLHNTWTTGYVIPADASFCNHGLMNSSLPVDSSHNFSSTITEIPVTQKHWQPHMCQPVHKLFPDFFNLFIYFTTKQKDMWHNFSTACLWMHTSYHLTACSFIVTGRQSGKSAHLSTVSNNEAAASDCLLKHGTCLISSEKSSVLSKKYACSFTWKRKHCSLAKTTCPTEAASVHE